MKFKKIALLRTIQAALIAVLLISGTADYLIDDSFSVHRGGALPAMAPWTLTPAENILPESLPEETHSSYTAMFGKLPVKRVKVRHLKKTLLCPGGMPFGAKMFTEGLLVSSLTEVDGANGFCRPAYEAGIRERDIILKINEKPVSSAEELAREVADGGGQPIIFTVQRAGSELTFTVTPELSQSEKQYKTGMWIRDNTAGIGTVTFIDPSSGEFAGLGHGICDSETGALLPLSRGIVMDVTINGVQKGASGTPGELKGSFTSGKRGMLLGNSDAGVYGIFTALPPEADPSSAIPIALKEEIQDGKATLLCTLGESGIQAYEVNIRKIRNALDNKNLEVTVTDPLLLEKTGGIVQGMSGSPLIQDGRLIGAVTHVLINDPTRGYGIFIENMLSAAKMAA